MTGEHATLAKIHFRSENTHLLDATSRAGARARSGSEGRGTGGGSGARGAAQARRRGGGCRAGGGHDRRRCVRRRCAELAALVLGLLLLHNAAVGNSHEGEIQQCFRSTLRTGSICFRKQDDANVK